MARAAEQALLVEGFSVHFAVQLLRRLLHLLRECLPPLVLESVVPDLRSPLWSSFTTSASAWDSRPSFVTIHCLHNQYCTVDHIHTGKSVTFSA